MSRKATTRTELVAHAKEQNDTDDLLVRKGLVPDTVEPVEGRERTVRFVISTDAVDRDNDTIDPKGWDLKAYLKNPVVLWAHDYRALPVGRAVSVVMRDGQLISDMEFATHDFAETVYQLVKGGFLKATSVGFRPSKYVINDERQGLDFKEQELMEYSIVPVPANPEALIDLRAAKAAGIDVGPVVAWAKAVLKTEEPAPAPEPEPTPDPEPVVEPVVEAEKAPADPPAMPDSCAPDDKGNCPSGYAMRGDRCYLQKKDDDKAPEPVVCRICEQELVAKTPRLRDDLGVVCAPCWRTATEPLIVAPVTEPTKEVDTDVLHLDDAPREEVVLELDDEVDDLMDLSPDEVRAALRSAITGVVGTIVRDETRLALNRARGRVD